MEVSKQEYWSGLPFPSPGDLPDPVIEPRSPALQADSLPSEPPGKSQGNRRKAYYKYCIYDFPGGPVIKNPRAKAGDTGLNPGLERFHMLWGN